MCSILVDIGMFIMGVVCLVRGKISLTRTRVVYGVPARIIGVILMLPFPLAFGGGMILGFILAAQGKPVNRDTLQPAATIIEIASIVLPGLAAVIIGAATAKAPRRKRRRVEELDEVDRDDS